MAPPNFLRSDPTDISNGSPAVSVPSGAYVPEQWYDDRIFVSFARCCWPFRMLLRCEPVEGCARFHQNFPVSSYFSREAQCVHVWCYWRHVLSLWRAPRPTAVSAVWRNMCYTRSACTGGSAATGVVTSLFFVIMAANGVTMYFFTPFVLRPWSIVPYSGAPVSLCRYCTSQPQYASRELQYVRYPTRRNIACSSHSRDKAVQCPQVVVS